jgi:GNAT superfamily N-acetyltransferase
MPYESFCAEERLLFTGLNFWQHWLPCHWHVAPSVYLAKEDGIVLGLISLRPTGKSKNCWQVDHLVIHPNQRGRGIAQELLRFAFAFLAARVWAILSPRFPTKIQPLWGFWAAVASAVAPASPTIRCRPTSSLMRTRKGLPESKVCTGPILFAWPCPRIRRTSGPSSRYLAPRPAQDLQLCKRRLSAFSPAGGEPGPPGSQADSPPVMVLGAV